MAAGFDQDLLEGDWPRLRCHDGTVTKDDRGRASVVISSCNP